MTRTLRTAFTDLVGCTVPIQQAGMGPLANPDLAEAVANAGGQGMVSVHWMPEDVLARMLDDLRRRMSGVVGCNFLRPATREKIRERVAVAAARCRVVDFFWDTPDPGLVKIVHDQGALACWQVGSRDEALQAADAGCDFIIAQGIEAGGHVRGQSTLLALLDAVLSEVSVPVLAAGGIATGRDLAAVLAAGASGARVGTRFAASEEAGAHPVYLNALIAAGTEDTVYTEAFSVGWPDAPHRVLRASLLAAERFEGTTVAEFIDPDTGERDAIPRFWPYPATKDVTGHIEAMPHWAGMGVGAIRSVQPAGQIVAEMAAEALALLAKWSAPR